ncbi:hypothetical protein [Bradyrhizobium sp. USDA 10063]
MVEKQPHRAFFTFWNGKNNRGNKNPVRCGTKGRIKIGYFLSA